MKSRQFLLASVSAIALLVAAEAKSADLAPPVYTKAPVVVPAPVYSWTGCYVGAHAGYGWGHNNYSQTGSTTSSGIHAINGRAVGALDTGGGLFGGQVGCNYQFASRWVVGLQGDGAATDLTGRGADPLAAVLGGPGTTNTIGVKTDWLASVTGRVGVTTDDNRALFYVKGGAAWDHNQWDLSKAFNAYSPNVVSETRTGWTVGAGVEYMFARNWTVFAEYNYYSFAGSNVLVTNAGAVVSSPPPALPASFTAGSQQIQTVKLGVNYLFSLGPTPVVAKY